MGIKLFDRKIYQDERGTIERFDYPFPIKDTFYSVNKQFVFRGMHYQKGVSKFVFCSKGEIIDFWLNLKTGEWGQVELKDKGILIPDGFAHGYYCLTETVVHYLYSGFWNNADEGGIKWDSFGFQFPFRKDDYGYNHEPLPILSDRDNNLPTYEDFINGR